MLRILNLIGAIALIFIALATLAPAILTGHFPTIKTLILDLALVIFGVSRFIAFGMPASPLVRPLRMVGLMVFIGYMMTPKG